MGFKLGRQDNGAGSMPVAGKSLPRNGGYRLWTALWLLGLWLLPQAAAAPAAAGGAAGGAADNQITIRSAKAGTAYHTFSLQLGEAIALASDGATSVTVEESATSAQSIIESARREGGFLFTAPPILISQAQRGEKPFNNDPRYRRIRSLFTIPYLTMHWVVRADSGIESFADLAGKEFIPGGTGSFVERQTAMVLKVLGLEGRIRMIDIDPTAALPAILNKQVAGFAAAGATPSPGILDLAQAVPIRLLGLSARELKLIKDTDDSAIATVIPKGTYPGLEADVTTLSLPAGIYTTTGLDNDAAYRITKAFWTQRETLSKRHAGWNGVTPDTLGSLGARLHPGALRYYREAGIPIPANLR
jgi:TRAP transporter TAXI family solute receptor